MKKIFIVGGAGFIGSHLVRLYVDKGYCVGVYDNFSVGSRDFLPSNPNLEIFVGDILETEKLSDSLQAFDPDILYHLAAIHHIPICEKEPEKALRVNIEGTQSVLTACSNNKIQQVIFTSSGAVYDISDEALSESHQIKPRDIYGISKLCGEELLQYYAISNSSQVVVARLFNTVGTNETNSHIIPDIMNQLCAGMRQIKLGNLHTRRDYVHVDDVAEALFLIGYTKLTKNFTVFNVGSGKDYSVSELINLCSEVIAEPIEVVSVKERQRKVDRPTQLANRDKITQVIGWQPRRNLKQALEEVWHEWQVHK